MLTLVAFSTAALLDERATYDGVIQFDALQSTVPGIPASPASTVAAGITISTVCVAGCSSGITALLNAVNNAAGTSNAKGTCGSSCTTSRRGLLQAAGGSQVTVTIAGATAANANALQNQISAGNLAQYGIPSTAVVTATSPTGAAIPLAAPAPVPLSPLNPSPQNPASLCLSTNVATTVLPCVTTTTLNSCLTSISGASSVSAFCCPCTTTAAGFQIRSLAGLAATCAVLPASTFGCGKHSKKGLLGLLGLLGLIPLLLCLLICCLCLLRRKRRGQAMLFSQTAVPAPLPAPMPHLHAVPPPLHSHVPVGGPDFHVHP